MQLFPGLIPSLDLYLLEVLVRTAQWFPSYAQQIALLLSPALPAPTVRLGLRVLVLPRYHWIV